MENKFTRRYPSVDAYQKAVTPAEASDRCMELQNEIQSLARSWRGRLGWHKDRIKELEREMHHIWSMDPS